MAWGELAQLGAVGLALLLGILYARASSKAAGAKTLEANNGRLRELLVAERSVVASKEEYIRELEKTVLGSLAPGQLADRLNRMFQANRGGAAGPVLSSIPKAGAPKP